MRKNYKKGRKSNKLGHTVEMVAATAQTRPSNGVLVAGLGGYQMGGRPIVLRQLLLWL